MAKPRDEQKIERIHAATLKLVQQQGFGGLKMAEVAKEAQVATGTLYVYFKDKVELINALYLHLKRKQAKHYLKPEDLDRPFKMSFRLVWENFLLVSLDYPEESAFIEQYYRSPFLRPEVRNEADLLLQAAHDVLLRGQAEELIKPLDTSLLLAHLSGSILELVKWHYAGIIELDRTNLDAPFSLAWDSVKR